MQTISSDSDRDSQLSCRLTGRAFAEAQQDAASLLVKADTIEERPDGYGFHFAEAGRFAEPVMRSISRERECCPFFTLEMTFEPHNGGLWLRFRGSAEIKAFLRDDLERMGLGDRLTNAIPTTEQRNVLAVRRLIDQVMNAGKLEVISDLFVPDLVPDAERWITPFLASFPDAQMGIVDLIASGDKVVGRFTCSGTHLGKWQNSEPTGRRFDNVDEVSIFHFSDGKIDDAWGIEDTLDRLEQLGLR